MATRNTPRKTTPVAPALSNRQIALELTKAALQGGALASINNPPEDSVDATRRHAAYAARLFIFVERRLDARDAAAATENATT